MNFTKKLLSSTSINLKNSNVVQNESQIDNSGNHENDSKLKKKIELKIQLEKQKSLREYRQSSTNKSQENNFSNDQVLDQESLKIKNFQNQSLSILKITSETIEPRKKQQKSSNIGLSLLNKIFLEIKEEYFNLIKTYGSQGPTRYDQAGQQSKLELEKKIYRLLPLFLNTFSESSVDANNEVLDNKNILKNIDLFDQFHDLPTFTQIISKLLVNEIRIRASNKTTQLASQSIVKFLELSPTFLNKDNEEKNYDDENIKFDDDENSNNGWVLLSSLNFLVCNCSSALIPVMANTSLPSTLVKCLYLFFGLPELKIFDQNKTENKDSASTSFQKNLHLSNSMSLSKIRLKDIQDDLDRRILLKKVFTQLLSRLCIHQSSVAELTKKDDLALLFNAITYWCPNEYNLMWRDTAAEVVINMIKYKWMDLEYIHEKRCIVTCIENISKMFELNKASVNEIGEMWCTLISFYVEIMNCNINSTNFSSNVDDNQVYSKQHINFLLNEFKSCNGYQLLLDFLLKIDSECINNNNLNKDYDKNLQLSHKLISLIALFVKVGVSDLKNRQINIDQLFIMDKFFMPKPSSKSCVRNSDAFNIFIDLWSKASSSQLQDYILAALITIYKSDKANYFILNSQNSLALFAENLYLKPLHVQEKFFIILEYVIFELRYIPCKELVAVGIILKENHSHENNLLYLKSLLSIIKFNTLFKDVYREVGIFDILIQLFVKNMNMVFEEKSNENISQKDQMKINDFLIEILHNTLIGPNIENCKLFDKINGPSLIYKILCSINKSTAKEGYLITKQMEKSSYIIIQQLISYNSGEERLALILKILNSLTSSSDKSTVNFNNIFVQKRKIKKNKQNTEVCEDNKLYDNLLTFVQNLTTAQKFKIKIRLSKLLFNVLKDSHRCRSMFRKTGGFFYMIMVLNSMENYFKTEEKLLENICEVGWKRILNLLKLTFSVITIAMRFEPANAKFVSNEIDSSSFSNCIRKLGCFTDDIYLNNANDDSNEEIKEEIYLQKKETYEQIIFSDYFLIDEKKPWTSEQLICLVIKLMYEMALDQVEKNKTLVFMNRQKSHQQTVEKHQKSSRPCSVNDPMNRLSSCSLTNSYYSDFSFNNTNLIVHPTIIISIFHLIPSIKSNYLKKFILEDFFKDLLENERNQQVLCSLNFIKELLSKRFNYALMNEHYFLHNSIQKTFVLLASQQIDSFNLRSYLRLTKPLNSMSYEEYHQQQKKKQTLNKLTSSNFNFSNSALERLKTGSFIPLDTIKTLSLIANKNNRQEKINSQFVEIQKEDKKDKLIVKPRIFQEPPFVEFDLNQEGFSCIFLPSIAPSSVNSNINTSMNFLNQNSFTNALLNTSGENTQNQGQVNGGIGIGERVFPPQNGLTYSTWFCIDQFSIQNFNPYSNLQNIESNCPSPAMNINNDSQNVIRLLTIVRNSKNGKDFCCLQIQIIPKEKCLVISTNEIPFFEKNQDNQNNFENNESVLKILSPNLFVLGEWHHLAIVLTKAVLKNSTCTVYLDGEPLANQKLSYISNTVGCSSIMNSLNNSQFNNTCVNAYIGTPPQLRRQMNFIWKQGPCHLIEDNLANSCVKYIYRLGPNYVGSFQDSEQNLATNNFNMANSQQSIANNLSVLNQINLQQITEERIMFGLNAKANSTMTIAKIRRVYSSFDCKQLAKLLSLPVHENATPIVVLHNSAGHLIGSARSLGGILIGYVGCRLFLPKPLSNTISEIGGCLLLHGIIANSNQEELFYAAVKFLEVILSFPDKKLLDEMKRVNGYQILVLHLRKKKNLLTCDIFNSIVRLTCEFEENELISLQPRIKDMYISSSKKVIKIKLKSAFKEIMIEHIDLWWQDDSLSKILLNVFDDLLQNQSNRLQNLNELKELGLVNKILFCLFTFKLKDQHSLRLIKKILFDLLNQTNRLGDILSFGQFLCIYSQTKFKEDLNLEVIELRNSFLKILTHLLTKNSASMNSAMQEKFVHVLGFDWFLLFIRKNVFNQETVILGLINLMILISDSNLYSKFREATLNGGWLKHGKNCDGQIFSNFSKDDESNLSINDVKLIGKNVINIGGNITNTIETNLSNLNNLTLENINKSLTTNILEKDESTCNNLIINSSSDAINFSSLKKIETSLFNLPGFQHLNWILKDHLYEPKVYLILFQCLLGDYQEFNLGLLEAIESFNEFTVEIFMQKLNFNNSKNNFQNQTSSNSQKFFVSDIVLCISNLINCLLENKLKENFNNEKNIIVQRNDLNNVYLLNLIQVLTDIYNRKKDFQFYTRNTPEFLLSISQLLIKQTQYRNEENFQDILEKDETLKKFREITISFVIKIIVDSLIDSTKVITRSQLILLEQFLDFFNYCNVTQKEILNELLSSLNNIVETETVTQNFISVNTPSLAHRPIQINLALNNIISFITILVDKVWQDSYSIETRKIFNFCLNYLKKINFELLEENSNSRVMHTNDLNLLFKSTNRIILYFLSRPLSNINYRMTIIEVFDQINQNRKLLFSHFNNDSTFYVCLTYCLMQFLDQEEITLNSSKKNKSTWNFINENLNSLNQFETKTSSNDNENTDENTKFRNPYLTNIGEDEGLLLIASSAKKVWEELFSVKQTLLEESLKTKLLSGNTAYDLHSSIADLKKIKPNIYDSCFKTWTSFIENEHQIRLLKAKCKQNLIQKKSINVNEETSANTDPAPSFNNNFNLNNFSAVGERLTNINKLSKVVGSGAGLMSKLVINTVNSTIKKDAFKSSSSISSIDTKFNNLPRQANIPFWNVLNDNQVSNLTESHLNLIIDVICFNYKNEIQKNYHLLKYLSEDWNNLEFELILRERAIFGPNFECKKLSKWQLDMTEGPNRMRKKMIRNDMFYINYPYRPEMDSPKSLKQNKFRQPISWDSIEYHKRSFHQFSSKNASMNSSSENLNNEEDFNLQNISAMTASIQKASSKFSINKSVESEENISFDNDEKDSESIQTKNLSSNLDCLDQSDLEQLESRSLLRLLEEGEKIGAIYKCARVLGLDSSEGLMLFGKENFYLIDGFTILGNNEIRDLDTVPLHLQDPVIPNCNTPTSINKESENSSHNQSKRKLISAQTTNQISCDFNSSNLLSSIACSTKKTCMKFSYEDIKEVHKRRYLLQSIALEVFSFDGRNSLLIFTRKQRNKIYTKLLNLAVNINDNAQECLAGQKRNVNIESGNNLLTSFIAETSVTQRWVRGEISNFQYLMHLNTLAGRSYNDLMQYPIFPWILADYKSQYINLNDKASFRDLSKPMGAQTENRLNQFLSRFKDFDCIQDSPPYHYGTFYSSAMIVASYLVRMEPFTQHFLKLQGGHFDLADRMFHSIEEAWTSASQNNMADVKELIPEFFYLPEFLTNSNRFDLGTKQNGVQLNDVILPPWAKNDPKEFIRLNREALESDYVSAHLNEWIDLIFGYKQQGQAAIENVNVFHHLFYEGNVDIYTIEDPLKKNAIIGFINNFGQIPKQLFKKAHPPKKAFNGNLQFSSNNPFFGSKMQNSLSTSNNLSTPPLIFSFNTKQNHSTSTTCNNSNTSPLTPLLTSMLGNSNSPSPITYQPVLNNEKLIMHNIRSLVQTNHVLKELRGAVGQIIQQEKNILAVEQNKILIPPHFKKYVAWGFADQSLRIGNYESDRASAVFESDLLPCTGEILCCAVANSRTMITGSTNSVVSVWRLKNKLTKIQLLQNLYGHTKAITSLAASSSYGILVSGSRDKTCIVWDLNKLTFVRQLGAEGYIEQNEEIKEKLKYASCKIKADSTKKKSSGVQNFSTSDDVEKSEASDSIIDEDYQFSSVHSAPISAICINESNGDIATCCSTQIFVWTINGDLLSCIDIFNYQFSNIHQENAIFNISNNSNNAQILCCSFSSYKEWDENNLFIVGCSDGCVKIYTMKYIQIPISENKNTIDEQVVITNKKYLGKLMKEVKKLTLQNENDKSQNKMNLDTSFENISSQEDSEQIKPCSSIKKISLIAVRSSEMQNEDDSSDDSCTESKKTIENSFLTNEENLDQVKINKHSKKNLESSSVEILKLSELNLSNSFKFENDLTLKPGFKWSRQLILQNELFVNVKEKAAISSLIISKDNKTLFVGDTKGRLFSFVVANISSQIQSPQPKSNNNLLNSKQCKLCSKQFESSKNSKKIQCQKCFNFNCSSCNKTIKLPTNQNLKVCLECFKLFDIRK